MLGDYKKDPRFSEGLKFGDVAQIDYVKTQAALCAEHDEKIKQGLRLFKVDVVEERFYNIEVYAEDEFAANDVAHEELKEFSSDGNYEIMDIVEVPE